MRILELTVVVNVVELYVDEKFRVPGYNRSRGHWSCGQMTYRHLWFVVASAFACFIRNFHRFIDRNLVGENKKCGHCVWFD